MENLETKIVKRNSFNIDEMAGKVYQEQEYNFLDASHRRELLGMMADELYKACRYNDIAFEYLKDDMEAAIKELRDELPFW